MLHELPTTVRLSEQGKDQLIKLKRVTGIRQWNILCRWALCKSLSDMTPPLVREIRSDSNVEMSWRTFSGPCDVAFEALLRQRMRSVPEGFENLSQLLHAHVHRGIGQLAGELGAQSALQDLLGAVDPD